MRARIRASFALLAAITIASPAATPPVAAAETASTPEQTLQLSLDEAVKRALENNVDIAVERFNPELSGQSVRSALGYYDPALTARLSRTSADQKGTSALSGGDATTQKTTVWNLGATAPLQPSGGTFSLDFSNRRTFSTDTITGYNPLFSSGLTLSLNQPLLRNFRIDAPRQQLRIARKNREISDVQFRSTIVNTVATVKGYYYDLIYAIDNLATAQKSLDLAKRLLRENEIRVKVGTMAPLDVVQAQSEVAGREEGVILAENQLAQAQDTLKSAIFPANDPQMWSLRIAPSDRPTAEPLPVDPEAAVRKALDQRTDMVAARKGLERSDISLLYARNRLLPDVNLVASYGASGAGGTRIERDPPFGGEIVGTFPGGYGDALSELFGRDFPTWTVGVNLAYAVPNRSARAAAAQAQISKDQAVAGLRRLELAVATQVRSAARGVDSGFKRVQSTQAARLLQAQRLDAEEKKFAAGMSTNFLVTQAQRDLSLAEVAELRAVLDYRRAIISFQRVQEAGLGGSGSVATFSE